MIKIYLTSFSIFSLMSWSAWAAPDVVCRFKSTTLTIKNFKGCGLSKDDEEAHYEIDWRADGGQNPEVLRTIGKFPCSYGGALTAFDFIKDSKKTRLTIYRCQNTNDGNKKALLLDMTHPDNAEQDPMISDDSISGSCDSLPLDNSKDMECIKD